MWVYGRNLCAQLSALASQGQSLSNLLDLEVFYSGDRSLRSDLERALPPGSSLSIHEYGMNIPFVTGLLRRASMVTDFLVPFSSASLLHGCANFIPLRGDSLSLVTLHDLFQGFPFQSPSTLYGWGRVVWYRLLLKRMVAKARCVVTVHPAIAKEIVQRYSPSCPIRIVYSPLDSSYLKTSVGLATLPRMQGHLLAFVSRDPRKNLKGILHGYAHSAGRISHRLIIVAPSEGIAAMVRREATARGVSDRVEVRSDVSQDAIVSLYGSASGVIFPSFAEGFGYPLYEALSQGTPVVCKKSLLIPELVEYADRAVFDCDPANPGSIAFAIDAMLAYSADPEKATVMVEKVRKVLAPELAAEKYAQIYRELLS